MRLTALGFLENNEVTQNGLRQLAQQDVSRIQIFYSYDKNPNIPGPSILPKKSNGEERTRDFCRSLVTLSGSRMGSSEDIDLRSARIGYNAFAYRGGWYHNPQTNKNTPWCRHSWKQEIVFS